MFPMGMQHCFIFSRECEGGRCVYESYYILHMKLYLFFFGVFLTHFCFVFDWVCVCVCGGGTCQHTQNCDKKNEGFMALSVKLFVTLLHAIPMTNEMGMKEKRKFVGGKFLWSHGRQNTENCHYGDIYFWTGWSTHMSATAIGQWRNIYGYIFLGSWFLSLSDAVFKASTTTLARSCSKLRRIF